MEAVGKTPVDGISPFIEAVQKTVRVQCGVEATVASQPLSVSERSAVGILEFAGATVQGRVALSFPETTVLAAMEAMLGMAFEELDAETADGAAEMMNIVFGMARTELNTNGYAIEPAIPKAAILASHEPAAAGAPVTWFTSELGGFSLAVSMG